MLPGAPTSGNSTTLVAWHFVAGVSPQHWKSARFLKSNLSDQVGGICSYEIDQFSAGNDIIVCRNRFAEFVRGGP